MLELLLILIFCLIGVITGIATGLLPGLHVNNIALILLSLSSIIITSMSFFYQFGITEEFIFLLISVFIISCSLSHTFHDVIPSTFLGAPDEDTALSVLPAHSLLLEGKGYEAVALSALGSFGAIIFCFIFLIPIRLIIGNPLFFYETLREIMFWVLFAISIIMICTEKAKIEIFNLKGKPTYIMGMLFALFVFFLSGIFGFIIFETPVNSPIGLSSPVLFPALAGLFGLPTLLTSLLTEPIIPTQKIEEPILNKKAKKESITSVATGSIGGILVSIIPGITSATGTIIAMIARKQPDENIDENSNKKQTIITLSAVNTACAFFVVVVMFIIMRSRSGATLAVMDLITIQEWGTLLMPTYLSYLLIALIFAGTLSYFFTLKVGKIFAKNFANLPYAKLVGGTILFISILVFLFTGFLGLLILLVATFIGLLPVQWGVRRSHCMGILLIPIMLYFL